MDVFFADDSKQNKPTRTGLNKLIGAGGFRVDGLKVRPLHDALKKLCREVGIPKDEKFKWSPGPELWVSRNLVVDERQKFHMKALAIAKDHDVKVVVALEDTKFKPILSKFKSNRELGVSTMLLERVDNLMRGEKKDAIVVTDRPGGGPKDQERFIAQCCETIRAGTEYATMRNLPMIVSMDSQFSRLLQLADVIVSCTTAFFSGENKFAPPVFEQILPLFRREERIGGVGSIGGYGVKVHPDFRYGNLYHWLLGDQDFWYRDFDDNKKKLYKLPLKALPYRKSGEDPA